MNAQLSKMAGMVTHWMVEDLALGTKFTDTEDDSQTIDDDEEAQEKRFLKIMRILAYYDPHEQMLQALNVNFTNESLSKEDTTFDAYMQTQCLDYDNACSVLTKLLSIEDVSTMQLYAQLIQPNVTLTKVHKLCYNFMLVADTEFNPEDVLSPYLDEVVLVPMQSLLVEPLPKYPIMALLPHKHEDLHLRDPMRRHVACLIQVTRQNVQLLFKPHEFPGDEILSQSFYVIIRSRRTPIRFMYRAMQLLQENPVVRRYLFPIKSPLAVIPAAYELPNLELLNASIAYNAEQLQAVKHIVNGPNPQAPYIVFGPPGTGKTTTIVEAILQLRLLQPRSRILVAASSNSACDTIALKICEYFAGNQRLQTQIAYRARVSRLITQDVEPNNQIIRLFSRSIFAKGLDSVHPLLLCNSNCSKRIYEHLGVNTLRQFGIIVSTLCTVGRLVTNNLGKFNFFTHVFIDEAGASMEPETLVGIMGIKQNDKCHVILSGDHKQLSAIITSNRAATLGLRHSLMERLLRSDFYALSPNGNYDQTLQTRLRRNYRSHPEIVELFNTLYYNGELIPKAPPNEVNLASKWNFLHNPQFPIIFQATHGVTQRELQSTSSVNALEAQVVLWYVKNILLNGLGEGVRVNQEDIGIIAPYLGQCRLIADMLRRHGYLNVEVGSVEKYQGREKAIIIATLVRSFSKMGFMRNPRRINVLLSRAKSLMILIGNPVTLRHHRDFLYIINECKQHGNYVYKKKGGSRRPNFLKDLEEIEEEEFDDEFISWYAEMPKDICVSMPSNTIEVSSSDETESSQDISSSTTDSSINLESLSLRNTEGILSIQAHCGSSVAVFTIQTLMQLQKIYDIDPYEDLSLKSF